METTASGRAPLRALIIGGSLAGLFTANLLRRIGWEVIVCERSAHDLASRGAGVSTHDELLGILEQFGIELDTAIGIETSANVCLDKVGRISHLLPIAPPRVATAWGRIYRPLKQRLPAHCYRPGITLSRVEAGSAGATALFADGTRLEADLLLAADGVQSTVRRQLLPDVKPRYAGYVCWRFVIAERDLEPAFRVGVAPHFAFFLADGQMLHGFLIPGPNGDVREGQRDYCIVWYRIAGETELSRLLFDTNGRRHEISIPPSLIRAELINEIRQSAVELLPPALARVIARAKQPLLQAIVDLESPRLAFGPVALLGDAAFTARPHVAAGVIKAAFDAQCLAAALAAHGRDIDSALLQYDNARRRVGHAIVARGRHLGAVLDAQPETVGAARLGASAKHPEAIMRDYGRSNLGDTVVV